jgi:hypothetical protein
MFHHRQASRLSQQWRSGAGEMAWLSMLVDAFEQASSSDLRDVPCSEPILRALQAQLERPALPYGGHGSDFRPLN